MARKHCPETARTRAQLYQPGTPDLAGKRCLGVAQAADPTAILRIEYDQFHKTYR